MDVLFCFLLLVVAFLYSSVGHGGASGYLALMALFAFSTATMKPTALVLNVFVAGIATLHYTRAGHFHWRQFWPFALGSIPMAYLGGSMQIDPVLYKRILAIFLVVAILRILIQSNKTSARLTQEEIPRIAGIVLGAGIGFFSGLIGIGGGILLTPLLLLLRWTTIKQAAALSAMFILVNSVSGLIGLTSNPQTTFPSIQNLILWVCFGVGGGWLGSRWGAFQSSPKGLNWMLAGVLGFAVLKLWFI